MHVQQQQGVWHVVDNQQNISIQNHEEMEY